MHVVFYSTSDVFKAEEILMENEIKCKVVPTPVTDKAYCGVCIEVCKSQELMCLVGFEYKLVE